MSRRPKYGNPKPLAAKAGAAASAKATPGWAQLPTPDTTGWAHTGVTLTPYTGSDVIDAAVTIDSADITGGLEIAHDTGLVWIKRSRITGGFGDGSAGIEITGTGDVLIEDVEIRSTDLASNATQFDRTISTALTNASRNSVATLTIRRVHAHGAIRGMDFSGDGEPILLEDCYHAFNYNPGVGERDHTTAIRAAGNTFSITVNNCVLGMGDDCFASGVIAMYPEFGPNTGLTINGGLFVVQANNDGAFGIAAGFTPPGESPNHDFNVTGLWISTEFYSEGCRPVAVNSGTS